MTDDYQLIPVPPPEDYRFKVLPQNFELMQATLATAREVYPSFGLYLEWASASLESLMRMGRLLYKKLLRNFRIFFYVSQRGIFFDHTMSNLIRGNGDYLSLESSGEPVIHL